MIRFDQNLLYLFEVNSRWKLELPASHSCISHATTYDEKLGLGPGSGYTNKISMRYRRRSSSQRFLDLE